VAPDDLSKPLGLKRSGSPSGRWILPLLLAVSGACAVAILAALAWVAIVDAPLGGEPSARAAIEDPATMLPADGGASVEKPQKQASSGSQIVTVIDGKSGARTEVAVRPGADDADRDEMAGAGSSIDARLTEISRHGAIPRIADDGTRPLEAYSRADPGAADRKGPQIVIVVGGLGVSATATGEAVTKLPKGATLAFVPYSAELPRWTARARDAGFEVLLQLPMEPFDYPDNDPGPQTLLSSLRPAENLDRLYWFLSRTQGYVGVTNFMGARFTANADAFRPVIAEIAARGLLYFDDGKSSRSITAKAAAETKSAYLKADIVIDAKPNWADIDATLEQLERTASDKGIAIGSAGVLPVTIERIARWARAAEGRGVRIVPLSTLVVRSKQS